MSRNTTRDLDTHNGRGGRANRFAGLFDPRVRDILRLVPMRQHRALDELRALDPDIAVDGEKRFIDNGRVIVSAGISAGIDMSLHVVARLLGKEQALETAQYMEYQWSCKDSQVRKAE